MALPIHQRYEIIFLSRHPLGPRLGLKAVAKAVKCDKKTVKYWLDRWKASKDLTKSTRSGRPRETTPKQDQQILSMANQQISVTSRDIENRLKRKGVRISQRTVRRRLNEAGAKFSPPMSKPLLNSDHQNNRLKWAEEHITMDWDQVIFSDETTLYLNQTKRRVWNLPGEKK